MHKYIWNGVVFSPRERFSNPAGKKATRVSVKDQYTGEKREYDRLCNAEKDLGGKRIKFRSKKGDVAKKKDVIWLDRCRKEVLMEKLD